MAMPGLVFGTGSYGRRNIIFAEATASFMGMPLAKPAATADDSVQPVPWVLTVATLSDSSLSVSPLSAL